MLQAVVADYHVAVGMRCQQRTRGGDALLADPHRTRGMACQQHRFIAALCRVVRTVHRARLSRAAAIAAADNAGLHSRFAQTCRQPQHQRRLAGAADADIADDDDGYRQAHTA